MTIMLKNYGETLLGGMTHLEGSKIEQVEQTIPLPTQVYAKLSKKRLDIASCVSANIIWDNESSTITLLGLEEAVQQTAGVLSQFVQSESSSRKLVGRSGAKTERGGNTSQTDATNMLVMSQLPPELTISRSGVSQIQENNFCGDNSSGGQYAGLSSNPLVQQQHSPLGRTVSDGMGQSCHWHESLSKTRRKLESEDSSYDSDHEALAMTFSQGESRIIQNPVGTQHPQINQRCLSRSHDDISRTASETLHQEFAEYISYPSIYNSYMAGALNNITPNSQQTNINLQTGQEVSQSLESLNIRTSSANSRDASPVLLERLESVQETPLDCDYDLRTMVQDPQYNIKVEKALKLGYPEVLTQKALVKVGLKVGFDELLNELIRLQQSKLLDPKEALLRETQEILQSTITSGPQSDMGIVPTNSAAKIKSTSSFGEGLQVVSMPQFRPIVIDGSNVAMSHGNKTTFSCKGIKICVDWFKAKGHKDITVFVPKWHKERAEPSHLPPKESGGREILLELETERLLTFTPSRQVDGKRIICHDDRYILNLATETGAVVVSNDSYKEFVNEKPGFKKVIEERILPFLFVNDRFMPPDDPLGRNGPSLDSFLCIKQTQSELPQPCPYGKMCTYGKKCKFFHVERGNAPHKSVTEKLKEDSAKKIQEVRTRNTSRDSSPGEQLTRAKSMNLPLQRTDSDMAAFVRAKQPLSRTRSSRPTVNTQNSEKNIYHDGASLFRMPKSEVSKSKSVDNQSHLRGVLRMSSVPTKQTEDSSSSAWPGFEMGCLSNYGLQSVPNQPPPGPWNTPPYNTLVHPPPTSSQSQELGANLHRRLERQLTINPVSDPRINRIEKLSPKHYNHTILTADAIEYMHRNPPPPLHGIPEQHTLSHTGTVLSDYSHQNVTRNASAPDSIRQWGSQNPQGLNQASALGRQDSNYNHLSGFGMSSNTSEMNSQSAAARSPMQRLNSTSDSHLNHGFTAVNRTHSSDPFSSAETWKYKQFESTLSPLLGSSMSSSIWSPSSSGSPPKLDTPPPSPSRNTNLGPVGSARRCNGNEQREELLTTLSKIFPEEQVLQVMQLMPEESNAKVLCGAIMDLDRFSPK